MYDCVEARNITTIKTQWREGASLPSPTTTTGSNKALFTITRKGRGTATMDACFFPAFGTVARRIERRAIARALVRQNDK
eukprot:scaffold2276_cov160-Amphora_coffeaeformis.AAC.15